MLLLVGAVALLRAPVYLYFSDPSIVPWSMGTGGYEKYVADSPAVFLFVFVMKHR